LKEQAIVQQSLSDLDTALLSSVTVRTGGGDEGAGPPLGILNWDSTRLSENGANPFAKIVRDSNGDAIGVELHRYHRMSLDIVIRAYDEGDRDSWLSDVADAFLPYEYDASSFHADTTEWEVGDAEPRSNPLVEPDWYEAGLTVRFTYVSRVTLTGDDSPADTLTSVQETVDGSTS
jgi:hypothetical protein